MRAILFRLQRFNGLTEQLKTIIFQRVVDASRPLHFAAATHQFDVIFLEAVNSVSSGFLGRGTGAVRCTQQCRHVFVFGGDRHHTNAHPETKTTIVPHEFELADRHPQHLGCFQGFIETTAFQQDAKFVTTEPRQRVPPANLRLE